MISTRDFAQKMGVDYRTALNWLRTGLVPGATEKDLPNGLRYWDIPTTALAMDKPKKGPKPGKNGSNKGKARRRHIAG